MLSAAKKERIRIMLKLETAKTVRPGTFVTPIDQLNSYKGDTEQSKEESPGREGKTGKSEDLSEYFKGLDEMERRKLNVILQNDEKYNVNVRNNLRFTLERIWKSRELEAA